MDKKRKKTYEKLYYVHCATVQVVNIGFLGDKMSKDDISITEKEISQRTNTAKDMAFKTTHNKDESLPQFMKSPQLIFSVKSSHN